MPIWMVRMYAEMLPRVRAEQQIAASAAAAYPHLEKFDGRAYMRDLRLKTGKRSSRKPRKGELEAMGIKVVKE